MIIEALKDFFSMCPHFEGLNPQVDFLGKDIGCYSINPVECEPIIKKYASGESLRQFVFTLSGRRDYDTQNSPINITHFENIAKWIEESDKKNILPQLFSGKTAQKIEVITSGHLFLDDIKSAGYMLKCRLIYLDNL